MEGKFHRYETRSHPEEPRLLLLCIMMDTQRARDAYLFSHPDTCVSEGYLFNSSVQYLENCFSNFRKKHTHVLLDALFLGKYDHHE